MSVESNEILTEISDYCRRTGLAESTFGRMAVNDGKLVSRLRDSGRVTEYTIKRIRNFITDNPREYRRFQASPAMPADQATSAPAQAAYSESYEDDSGLDISIRRLQFVGTTSERKVIAHRLAKELPLLQPTKPALRIMQAGADDGEVLSRVLASAHRYYRDMPHYVVCKCANHDEARTILESLAPAFIEHPNTVLVLTNLSFGEAASLTPDSLTTANNMVWHDFPFDGRSSHNIQKAIFNFRSFLLEQWQSRSDPNRSGPFRPVVMVFHREDRSILLDHILPRRGDVPITEFDLIMAPHVYRSRSSLDFRARRVLAPLAKRLGRGGRLVIIQAQGKDPSYQIVKQMWPEENPFPHNRNDVLKAVSEALPSEARNLNFIPFQDEEATLCYELNGLVPGPGDILRASSVNAAFNAVCYVTEVAEGKITAAFHNEAYLKIVRDVVAEHNGLWMHDEVFVISKSTD